MAKIKVQTVAVKEKQPEIINNQDKLLVYVARACTLFNNQVTDVDFGASITIPEGYIGLVVPVSSLIISSSVIVAGKGGFYSGTFKSVVMRKGVSGSVKLRRGDPLATITLLKVADVTLVDDSTIDEVEEKIAKKPKKADKNVTEG